MRDRSQVEYIISRDPDFEDAAPMLHYAPRMPKGMIKETHEVVAMARRFNDEVARPLSVELDRRTHEDANYLPWDLVKKANEWGFYTMWVPRIFGGKGYNMPSLSYFVEEIGSVCLGIANVIGVHYLGIAGLMMAGNTSVIRKVMHDVVKGEKTGEPCIIAFAVTEPMAGTDVEEVDLMDKGKITCRARKVNGGYIINGTKIFISMGRVSKWTVVHAFIDPKKASETMVIMMVKEGMKGFTVGSHENKMGQRICPASVLYFDDCYVPDELVMFDPEKVSKFSKQPVRDILMRYIDNLVCITRPAVGSFGTSAARGAFEAALKFANETELDGKPMINHEWVQCRLAEMYANVRLGRLAYVDANTANSYRGVYNLLQMKPMYYYLKYTPRVVFDKVISHLLNRPIGTWLMSKWYLDWQKPKDQHCCTGLASLAKFTGTDFGVRNCQMALELMGQTGLRHENGVEKILRDAKLLQIYEGTNQLNRLNLFKSLIAPACPKARVFEE
jgi:acyl-CoA dehydrogenase